ncbi:MAG: hypothetical protein R3258_10455 [Acidimicrobiia bacterium]|nr:hypothetical protein [Acidimicrobiia bacterium]
MATIRDKLAKRLLGDSDFTRAGFSRVVRGLRAGDRRELAMGLILSGLAYFRRSRPEKTLVYRTELKEGSAVVIRNTAPGQPPVVVENPKKP